jgi:aminoglycoside 6'-N-acetyltransferase I
MELPAMEPVIRPPYPDDRAEWTRMRAALWPENPAETHAEEIAAFLTGNLTGWLAGLHAVAVFVAARPGGGLCGFVEASLRPMADDCATHPVGYVEGWFVDPDMRQKGVGRALVASAEAWAATQGCREMASDARLSNSISIAAHKALGFEEEPPSVHLRKWLPTTAAQVQARSRPEHKLTLAPLEGAYAVCRLDAHAPLPAWAAGAPFVSIARTADELSVVCREKVVPEGVRREQGWRCLRVAGTLDFSLVGVLASLLDPLAAAGVGVFVVSTFDTDYLLVKQMDFHRAKAVLQGAGHAVGG